MDRKEFLKFFGIGGVGLVLPNASQLPASGLLSRPVKIYDNYIKGVGYYDLGKCFREVKVGDMVVLQRFQDHQYDRFALGVRWKGFFLGYLPAFENIVLANLMDAGAELHAMVTAKHSFHELGVGVWAELILNKEESPNKLSDTQADNIGDIYRRGRFHDYKKKKT